MDSEYGQTALVWAFDAGAEERFPICLYSLLRVVGRERLGLHLIILDCGISEAFREWLGGLTVPRVSVIKLPLPAGTEVIDGGRSRAVGIMRLRIELPDILSQLMRGGAIPKFKQFAHLDTDTAFLSSPIPMLSQPIGKEDIVCCYEWDWTTPIGNNVQALMRLVRPSTFGALSYPANLNEFAAALNLELPELHCVPTVNSGVWMARVDSQVSGSWLNSYRRLHRIDSQIGPQYLNPYSAEQNALSIAIYKGEVVARFMSRNFNHLPPREPYGWPAACVIAHFVTFAANWKRPAFRLWSALRKEAVNSGFVHMSLVHPSLIDP